MIAKIVKSGSFKVAVNYILDKAKGTELLAAEGVRTNSREAIIRSFVAQAAMNPRLSKSVCHVSLSFSPEDRDKLTNEAMVRIAQEYLAKMGVADTQYIIGRHHDKEHPHIHIVFNRVANDGSTISDKNDRFRSEKICKELTQKYGLHFATGKDRVNEERLREPDKTKYEIYNALKSAVPACRDWRSLEKVLLGKGIGMTIINNGSTTQPQGVRFSKNGYHFNGSKIDRAFSYSKIDWQLRQNSRPDEVKHTPGQSPSPQPAAQKGPSMVGEAASAIGTAIEGGASLLGDLFDIEPNSSGFDAAEAELQRQLRKKKKKPKGPKL